MSDIVPFPRIRDRGYVWRQARRMAELKPKAAENWLSYILRKHRETLEGRGIGSDIVEEQVAGLEGAIRADLHAMVSDFGGVA